MSGRRKRDNEPVTMDLIDSAGLLAKRGAKTYTEIARGLIEMGYDVHEKTFQNWIQRGKDIADGDFKGRKNFHRMQCMRLYRTIRAEHFRIAESLRATRLMLARGVLDTDEKGKPIPGRYRIAPSERSLDVAQHLYDPEFSLPGKETTINAGDGWSKVKALMDAAAADAIEMGLDKEGE